MFYLDEKGTSEEKKEKCGQYCRKKSEFIRTIPAKVKVNKLQTKTESFKSYATQLTNMPFQFCAQLYTKRLFAVGMFAVKFFKEIPLTKISQLFDFDSHFYHRNVRRLKNSKKAFSIRLVSAEL